MIFTADQQKVIEIRNHNVLVSAAAGSGKTAVLVERIIGLITDKNNPIDIDKLLVVTFTNAAAAEMRERIYSAILARLKETPEDANLQRQAVLIHHAMIMTIDSFCRFILMNHFQDIDLDPGFSIGDPGKMKLMAKKALEKVMEEAYASENPEFLNLANAFSKKGRDDQIEEMVQQIFSFVMSKPYPKKWLQDSMTDYMIEDFDDFQSQPFFQSMVESLRTEIKELSELYQDMILMCQGADGPESYLKVLDPERDSLDFLWKLTSYDDLYRNIHLLDFARLPAAGKNSCDENVKKRVQALRTEVKDRVKKLQSQFFYEAGQDFAEDMYKAGKLLRPLLELTNSFMEQFAEDKRKENVIDFADMEHFALDILVDQDGQATETAKWYQSFFETVMIDEYQDSNDVQELLLSVVSREYGPCPNRFMVGDMKQSIYRFRMARPEIFMEKYNRYGKDENDACERIDLKQNFRSRKSVLSLVNKIFFPLMQKEVGGVLYDEAAALYPGAVYPEDSENSPQYCPELLLFELKDENNKKAEMEADLGEAVMIANRIKKLMSETKVTDKKTGQLRKMEYDDIVILTRSIGSLAKKLQDMLKKEGIPTTIPSKTGYFASTEIRLLMDFIEVCVNPYKDIALAAVLKSPFYSFSDEELSQISLQKTDDPAKESFYEKLKLYESPKAKGFLQDLSQLRQLGKTETVHDFLYTVIRKYRYLDYVAALPAGGSRRETVEMLLMHAKTYEQSRMQGLFGFLQYMKQLEKYEIDYGSGSEDQAKSVRLMTIHKSKGLEFPICFVAGLGKQFNRRDMSGSLLLHGDLGIGIEYRNYDERFCRSTIKQKWIARQQLADSMGEELRVLYVALTRAKEKCILTGTVTDYADTMEKCHQLIYGEWKKPLEERKLNSRLLVGCTGYLKLIFYVMALYKDSLDKLFSVQIVHEEDLQLNQVLQTFQNRHKKEVFIETLMNYKKDNRQELVAKMDFSYPHRELNGLYNKTSVSELKHAALHEDEQTVVIFDTEKKTKTIPKFMKEDTAPMGATRGSVYHRLMELLDFKMFSASLEDRDLSKTEEKLKETLIKEKDRLVSTKFISEKELKLIDDRKIINFFQSSLGKEMIKADKKRVLFKEQPFVMEIPARKVKETFPEEETMLIQGIIDAYYEKDGKLYLMDYKTDRVEKKEDLVTRYQIQLEYYRDALQRITGKEVADIVIYSFFFSDTVAL